MNKEEYLKSLFGYTFKDDNYNYIVNEFKKLEKEIQSLKEDIKELEDILEMFNKREYRSKYLKERRKEQPNLLYPDSDEIYKRYYEQKEKIKNAIDYIKNIDDEEFINTEHYVELLEILKGVKYGKRE